MSNHNDDSPVRPLRLAIDAHLLRQRAAKCANPSDAAYMDGAAATLRRAALHGVKGSRLQAEAYLARQEVRTRK